MFLQSDNYIMIAYCYAKAVWIHFRLFYTNKKQSYCSLFCNKWLSLRCCRIVYAMQRQ